MLFDTPIDATVIEKISRFASRDESDYAACGVFFSFTREAVRIVATDRRKLVIHKPETVFRRLPQQIQGAVEFIMPTYIIPALKPGSRQSWTMEATGDEKEWMLSFKNGDYRITCPAVSAVYPEFEHVFPDPMPTTFAAADVVANRRLFIDVLQYIDDLEPSQIPAVRIAHAGGLNPIVVTTNFSRVALMPMQADAVKTLF